MTLQYAILVYESEADQAVREEDGAAQGEVYAAYRTYTEALIKAGKFRGAEALELPHTATTVTARPGQPLEIQDGPYADTKDQLAGFYLIDAGSLDEAIAWAAQCPAAQTGRVEIRPVVRQG